MKRDRAFVGPMLMAAGSIAGAVVIFLVIFAVGLVIR